jgi:hypothetical protein
MNNEYRADGGMRNDRKKPSTRRKPVTVPLWPPQFHRLDLGYGVGSGGKPETNRLSYGKAQQCNYYHKCFTDI